MEQLIKRLKNNGYFETQSPVEKISFILRKFSEWFPFENTDVINRNETDIYPEFLINKMVNQQRGGLCYDINPLLFLVLQELGFDASLGAATINNEGKWVIDQTHALVFLHLEGQKYIADSGFGNQLALSPLQLDGKEVVSPAGTFRLRTRRSEKGTFALECLKDSREWNLRYAFNWEIISWGELSLMKRTIHKNPRSPFNKQLLITRVLPDGTQSFNEKRQYRKWIDGREETIHFENDQFLIKTIRSNFSTGLAEEVEYYVTTSKES